MNNTNDGQPNTEAWATAAMAVSGLPTRTAHGGAEYILIPPGYDMQSLEKFQDRPNRISRKASFGDLESFLRYVLQFHTLDTAISLEPTGPQPTDITFVAHLDYHSVNNPAWCEHLATLALPLDRAYSLWLKSSGGWFRQDEFAEWLLALSIDVVEPDAATMLEIAQSLNVSVDVEYESSTMLANGQVRAVYKEIVSARAGERGQLVFPSTMKLSTPIFREGPRITHHCRLRFRVREKKLSIRYDILNPEIAYRDAVMGLRNKIETVVGKKPFIGCI